MFRLRACRADILAVEAVMPGAKSNRGGRRKGAGRKRKLTVSDRQEIASDYFDRQQEGRDFDHRRDAIIDELSAKYGVTDRMVKRCLVEFLPAVRWNKAIYGYANEGEGIQPLPARKIRAAWMDKSLPAGEIQLTCDACAHGRFHTTLQYKRGERGAKAEQLRALAREAGWTTKGGVRCPRCSKARRMVEVGRDL